MIALIALAAVAALLLTLAALFAWAMVAGAARIERERRDA